MQEEDTLGQMANIDLDAPLDIKVVFDDSDDEENMPFNKTNEQNQDTEVVSSIFWKLQNDSSLGNEFTTPCNDYTRKRKLDKNVQNDNIHIIRNEKHLKGRGNDKTPSACSDSLNNSKNELLDTLIEHLNYIMKAHQRLVVAPYNKISDEQHVSKSYTYFRKIKYQFFELSYSIIKSLLVPLENDPVFVMNLIDKTINSAKEKLGISNYNRDQLKPLFDEMVQWTKKQKIYLQDWNSRTNSTRNSRIPFQDQNAECSKASRSTINHQPSQIAKNSSVPIKENIIMEPKTCLFSHGSANNAIEINIEASILKKYQKDLIPSTDLLQSSHNENIKHLCDKVSLTERQSFGAQQGYNQKNKDNLDVLNRQQSKDFYLIQQLKRPPTSIQHPPPYHEALKDLVESSKQFLVPESEDSLDLQKCLNPNRSTSTDSGFISPLSFDNPDPLPTATADELHSGTTPLITHVTSLNPEAKHLKYGSCFICGQVTNKMCIGCYKHFYCSHRCQRYHWKRHRYYCHSTDGFR